MNLTLRQLRAFTAGARAVSFSEAARAINLTQPGYSLIIRQLEDEVGMKLFDRTTRRLALTPAGHDFALRVEKILADLDNACRDLDDLRLRRRGKVTIAVLPSTASTFVPKVVQALARDHPGLTVSILERLAAPLIESVSTGEADFGFGISLGADDEIRFTPMVHDRLVGLFPMGDSLATGATDLSWRQLITRPYVCFVDNTSLHHHVDRAARESGLALNVVSEVTYMTTAVSLVQAGIGFTILPELALGSLNLDGVILRPIIDPPAVRSIGTIMRAGRVKTPATLAALDALDRICREQAGRRPAGRSRADTAHS